LCKTANKIVGGSLCQLIHAKVLSGFEIAFYRAIRVILRKMLDVLLMMTSAKIIYTVMLCVLDCLEFSIIMF